MNYSYTLICLCLLVVVGCSPYSEGDLVGKWQGAQLLEGNEPLDLSPAEISFEFFESGAYEFQSTLKYREKGSFYLDGDLLVTTDTMNQASVEKTVAIVRLSSDSLHLLMDERGKERLLKLARIQ